MSNTELGSTAKHRPDLLDRLFEPFYYDMRGEHREGDKPFYPAPISTEHKGRLFNRYVHAYSQPGGMRAAYNHYRVMPQDQRDNIESFGDAKLTMPVLTIAGGAHSGRGAHSEKGDLMKLSLERVSDDFTSFVVEGTGHWVPEEQPQKVAGHLHTFFSE